jgi:ferric-dicitrate binding protein FerR (iron transport regulator)
MNDDDQREAWTAQQRADLQTWAAITATTVDAATATVAIDQRRALHRSKFAWLAAASACALGLAFVAGRISSSSSSLQTDVLPLNGATTVVEARRSITLGSRGIAVANAGAELSWSIDGSQQTQVNQRRGSVFYRVEHGGPFVVHTIAGDISVTGTCFNVEISMKETQQKIASGAIGAVLAAAVVVTVYEGGVVVAHGRERTTVSAGETISLSAPNAAISSGSVATASVPTTNVAAASVPANGAASTMDVASMSEQQLVGHIAILEKQLAAATALMKPKPEDYKGIHPNAETLQAWAKQCRFRVDSPSFDDLETPVEQANSRISAVDLPAYNAALVDVHKNWLSALRAAFVEVTGDQARSLTLTPMAMMREIGDKSGDDESIIRARIANERGGNVAAPTPGAAMTAMERYVRTLAALGDDTEAALGKRLGPQRAKQIRGDGWWNNMIDFVGCPQDASESFHGVRP